MSVTSAYIECATGKCYHLIELGDSFLLKYRYWSFAEICIVKDFHPAGNMQELQWVSLRSPCLKQFTSPY